MLTLRSTLEVRTVPERVMEWLLLFVPPDVFELLLQRLGFDAKLYALAACIVGMLVLLAALGAFILVPAQQYLAYRLGASQLYLIGYSAVFLGVMLLLPRGIIPSLADRLDSFERTVIARALAEAGGNIADAARRLHTDRPNLYRRMKRLGINATRV